MSLLKKRISQANEGKFVPLEKKELKILLNELLVIGGKDFDISEKLGSLSDAILNGNNKLVEHPSCSSSLLFAYSLMRWLHTGNSLITVMLSENGAIEMLSEYNSNGSILGLNATLISQTDRIEGELPSSPVYIASYSTLISHSLIMDLSPLSAGSYIRGAELLIPNGAPFITGELPVVSVPVSYLETTDEKTLSFSINTFKFIFSRIKSGCISKESGNFDIDQATKKVQITDSGILRLRELWCELTSDSNAEPGLYNLYVKLFKHALEAAWIYEAKVDYGFNDEGDFLWALEGGDWGDGSEQSDELQLALRVKHGINSKKFNGKPVNEIMNSYDLLNSTLNFCMVLPFVDKKIVKKDEHLKRCAVIKQSKNVAEPVYDVNYVSGQRVHQSALNDFLSECKSSGVKANIVVRTDSMKSLFRGLPDFVNVKTHYEMLDSPAPSSGNYLLFEHPNSKLVLDCAYLKITKSHKYSSFKSAFCSFDTRFSPGSNEGVALDVFASNYSLATNEREKRKALNLLLGFWRKNELDLKKRADNAMSISGNLRCEIRKIINFICEKKWSDLNVHEMAVRKLLGNKEELIKESLIEREFLINSDESNKAKAALKNELLSIYYQHLILHYKSKEVSYLNAVLSGGDFSQSEQSEKRLKSYLSKLEASYES
jgi:hypothetical protein